jgi:hypothetical protein
MAKRLEALQSQRAPCLIFIPDPKEHRALYEVCGTVRVPIELPYTHQQVPRMWSPQASVPRLDQGTHHYKTDRLQHS